MSASAAAIAAIVNNAKLASSIKIENYINDAVMFEKLIERRVESHNDEIALVANFIERIRELQTESTNKDNAITKLQKQVAKLTTSIDDKKTELATANGQVSALQKELNDKVAELTTANGQVSALQKELNDKIDENTKLTLAITDKDSEIAKFKSVVAPSTSATEIDELKKKIEDLEKAVTMSPDDIKDLKLKLADETKRADDAEAAVPKEGTKSGNVVPDNYIAVKSDWANKCKSLAPIADALQKEVYPSAVNAKNFFSQEMGKDIAMAISSAIASGMSIPQLVKEIGNDLSVSGSIDALVKLFTALDTIAQKHPDANLTTSRLAVNAPNFDVDTTDPTLDKDVFRNPLNTIVSGGSSISKSAPITPALSSSSIVSTPPVSTPVSPSYTDKQKRIIARACSKDFAELKSLDDATIQRLVNHAITNGLLSLENLN
jgi:myosin heavy subunit